MDQQIATLKNQNLYRFFGDVKEYIELGPPASIIFTSSKLGTNDREYRFKQFELIEKLTEFLS